MLLSTPTVVPDNDEQAKAIVYVLEIKKGFFFVFLKYLKASFLWTITFVFSGILF